MTKDNSKAARDRRRREAEERQAEADARSPQDQLDLIAERLGEAYASGAVKEKARLAVRMDR